jgi:proteasome lid subunit RPN8/RPN11
MLHLSKNHLGEVIKHCQKEYPKEACGILAGKDGLVKRVYPMKNREESETRYFIDPKEQFKVMKEMRKDQLELLAIYHSHVKSEAFPSKTDVDLAFYPEALYMIISLVDFDQPIVRTFQIKNGRINEVAISIQEL